MLRNFLALQLAISILGALFVYELLVKHDDRRRRRRVSCYTHGENCRNGHKIVPMPREPVHPPERRASW